MMLNDPNPLPVKVNREDVSITDNIYLGSTVRKQRGAGKNLRNRLKKARINFRMLNKVKKSSQFSTKLKLRMYQTAYFPPYCSAQNAGGLLKLTSTVHSPPSIPRTLGKSCKYSDARPSPTKNLLAVTKTAWAPSSYEAGGDGSDM